MEIDVLIFGGGAAGLWLLDTLFWSGARALLLESDRLGTGQTIAAQGIIHGGLKYTLRGSLTPSAVRIRDMPQHWRECLAGQRHPDLSGTRMRAPHCHLWRTDSLSSRLGMMGARIGLNVTPQLLPDEERPPVLQMCPGPVARLSEPVIAPDSLLNVLFSRHSCRILKIDHEAVTFELDQRRNVRTVRIQHPTWGRPLALAPRHVVLTAGKGNAELRRRIGLCDTVMQCRPLQMVLARGPLPVLNGHCVDGAATRVTITTDRDRAGRTIWQIGGQIAETGAAQDDLTLIRLAKSEIEAVLPGLNTNGIEWSTYRVDRAEGATESGTRPETFQVIEDQNVLTAWPTKLVLAPLLAEQIAGTVIDPASVPAPLKKMMQRHSTRLTQSSLGNSTAAADWGLLEDWPRPEIAELPWETQRRWLQLPVGHGIARKAA